MLRAQVFKGHWYGWHVVYTLRDAEGNVRYVGCTSQPLASRLRQHVAYDGPTGHWIRQEIAAGRDVIIRAEKRWKSVGTACMYERKLIDEYRKKLGSVLLNREPGRKPLAVATEQLAECANGALLRTSSSGSDFQP